MRGLGRRQQLSAVGDAALLLRIFAHRLHILDFLIDFGCVDERAPPTLVFWVPAPSSLPERILDVECIARDQSMARYSQRFIEGRRHR